MDAVVALDVRTGALIWQFQTVHHNLFTPPSLQGSLVVPYFGAVRTGAAWGMIRDRNWRS
jgi:hypothetical protein